ncbi:MAG TPA: glycosyltransferase family 39 protein [Lacunisphaera sp.]|nr:glycosyltransferase family 39 protein [Lacunisphaera sp.]
MAFLAAILLALHFTLAVGSKRHESTTADELIHVTAGYSYWKNNDYRLHPENGNLTQRWIALPLWLAGATFPPLEGNAYWRISDFHVLGHEFFYETGEDHFPRLMRARGMVALLSVGLGLLIFLWSRRLFGDPGGLISLGFYAFAPAFLANGALATSDVGIAFFLLAAAGAWWRHLHRGDGGAWAASALLFGLAQVVKYSGVLLLPVMAATGLVRAVAPAPLTLAGRTFATRWAKLAAIGLSLLAHGAVGVLVIWTCYGFRYSAFNPALPGALQFIRPWSDFTGTPGLMNEAIQAARAWHLLPEAYLYGFAYTLETVRVRAAFLNGEYSNTGWPSYFLWTAILKSTVPFLLGCGLGAGLLLRRWLTGTAERMRQDLYRTLPLAALFVVYWISALTSHLNIGERHLLPAYAPLFIALGGLGALAAGGWLRRWAVGAGLALLLAWHVGSAARIAPHFLAYFNELAGGPGHGRFHLTDSSLDWGQDLPGLKDWLASHAGSDPVYLSYFGAGEPGYYGIHARRLAFLNNFKFLPVLEKLEPGTYCISATILTQVYGPGQGRWTPVEEAEYQRLRILEPLLADYSRNPQRRAELERNAPAVHWQIALQRYDELRLARLCQYLRVRPPDADIGYSIYLYRLTAEEIAGATAGPVSALSALVEKAVQANP